MNHLVRDVCIGPAVQLRHMAQAVFPKIDVEFAPSPDMILFGFDGLFKWLLDCGLESL